MNSLVVNFSAPNWLWKAIRLSLKLCCSAKSVNAIIALTQYEPLRVADK